MIVGKINVNTSYLFISLLCGWIGFSFLPGYSSDRGIWTTTGAHGDSVVDWKASWIWLDEQTEGNMMLARRNFQLEELPETAMLRITATERYQLFINGTYVHRGPSRCAPHHQSYDILNVSDLLAKGKNNVSVKVHYLHGKRSYQHDGRPGLLMQLNMDFPDHSRVLATDGQWRAVPDPSWSQDTPALNRFQAYVADRIDFREYIKDWNQVNFDDTDWPWAKPLIRLTGWPSPQQNSAPQPLTPPWTHLVPRDIPYLAEEFIPAKNLILNNRFPLNGTGDQGLVSVPIDLMGSKRIEEELTMIPEQDSGAVQVLLYDFGEVINGMVQLEIKGSEGAVVDIMYAPYVVGDKFTHQIVDSDYRDRIILSGNLDKWESIYFKPTRFLALAVHNETGKTALHNIGINRLSYPFEDRGHIVSPKDPWVENYYKASKKTLRVCTTDAYTDNYREKRQYAQTGYYAALGNYWTFGDHALQRRYLVQVAQEQYPNGIMPAYAPLSSSDYMVIFDSNLLWIRSLHSYLLYSGDYKTVKALLPSARKLMELAHSFTDTLGVINDPPYAYWIDHAKLDRRGANFTLNGHYLGALEDFYQLLIWMDSPEAEKYLERAFRLRGSLRDKFWDKNRQLFTDALIEGERSDQFSEHSNGIALATNIATEEQAKAIANQLLVNDNHNYIYRESDILMVTPAMSYMLHSGLCEYGYIKSSFDLFRKRFDKMLDPSTNQTLWEEWWLDGTGRSGQFAPKTRSDAQTESAFSPALIAEYIFGIKPLAPGMKKISIKKTESGIKGIEGTFPTPHGALQVNWDKQKEGGILKVWIPGDLEALVDLFSLSEHPAGQVRVNGKPIGEGMLQERFLPLSKGAYEIIF